MFLSPVTEGDIVRHIKDLKSTGSIDGLKPELYKRMHLLLATPITHIVNLCLQTGIFPDICKLAYITPIPKGGDKSNPDNLRPISSISTLAKIIEKCIKDKTTEFLDSNKFFAEQQHGFLAKRNTQGAILQLTEKLYNALNDGKPALAIFLDLKKAFDTVPHNILLHKLQKIGIRGVAHSLFKSYLSNRTQRVKLTSSTGEPVLSDPETVTCGVPQGTVLGPLLFLIFVNELCTAKLLGASVVCYADDTALTFSGDSWERIQQRAEVVLRLVKAWLDSNQLSLNLVKTVFVPFSISPSGQPTNCQIKLHNCPVSFDCNHTNQTDPCNCLLPPINCARTECNMTVTRVSSVKYLGVVLDENLKWNLHISQTVGRLRKTIYIFHRLRKIASRNLLRQVYFALVQSIIQYAVVVWGGAYQTQIKALSTTVNTVIKVALGHPRRYPTNLIYQEFMVPDFYQVSGINLLMAANKINHQEVARVHNIGTRSRPFNLYAPRPTGEFFKKSPAYRLIRIFNALPTEIKSLLGTKKFKEKAKQWVLAFPASDLRNLLNS